MFECSNCAYYDDTTTYPGTGFCELNDNFVTDDDTCDDFEEE